MGATTEKLEELILYLAKAMEQTGHVDVGRLKLVKLLFEIDFEAYARLSAPVTGAHYHADRLGPVPAEELTVSRDLESRGRLSWTPAPNRRVPTAMDTPTMTSFTARELLLIDEVLLRFQSVPANAMVDKAHDFPGWIHAWDNGRGQDAPIPYEAIFWDGSRRVAADWENEHAAGLAARHGITAAG